VTLKIFSRHALRHLLCHFVSIYNLNKVKRQLMTIQFVKRILLTFSTT